VELCACADLQRWALSKTMQRCVCLCLSLLHFKQSLYHNYTPLMATYSCILEFTFLVHLVMCPTLSGKQHGMAGVPPSGFEPFTYIVTSAVKEQGVKTPDEVTNTKLVLWHAG